MITVTAALEQLWSKYSSKGKQLKKKTTGAASSPEPRKIIKNQNNHLYK